MSLPNFDERQKEKTDFELAIINRLHSTLGYETPVAFRALNESAS